MKLDIINFLDLNNKNINVRHTIESILQEKGIIGIQGIPHFETKTRTYINAVRKFCALDAAIKQKYAPNRDIGDTEGYELGAEWFKNKKGEWQIDDKKASFYAFVPDHPRNKWPQEMDLRSSYLDLGELIFQTGKKLLDSMGLNIGVGLEHDKLVGYGRMLHYHKESDATNENKNWCGAHFDHGVFTGLTPAYYFQNDIEIDEPEEAGLYIKPSNGGNFEKINAADKSILLFQVGEFGQIISNDRIKATQHKVLKAQSEIERFTFALFYSADNAMTVRSQSILTADDRYRLNQAKDGSLTYDAWQRASFERYRAKA